jgi:hypothetical protein
MSLVESSPVYTPSNIPSEPRGLGTDTIWFGGGRTGLAVAAHGGIERIVYFGLQPLGRVNLFATGARSAYEKILRPYLVVADKAYVLELNNTLFYPGGYRSFFKVPELAVEVEHDLALIDDAILQTVRVIRNKRGLALRFRISVHEYTRQIPAGRTWGDWQEGLAKNAWIAEIIDEPTGHPVEANEPRSTWFGVVGDRPLTSRHFHSSRRYFETGPFKTGAATIAAMFGFDKATFLKRAAALKSGGSKEAAKIIAGWERDAKDAPRVKIGEPAVESFFRMAPLLLKSLIVGDQPGAIRASVSHYGAWAWDTMVHCEAHLAMGDDKFARDVLELYFRTADEERGIGHAFNPEMTKLHMNQPPAAQGLYIYLLYIYFAYTGDTKTLRKYYPFSVSILKRALASRGRAGLFEGTSLFPDFPIYAGQTGEDISTFNNSVIYQAARVMEHLAGLMGDAATAETAREAWQTLGPAFRERLWDGKKGFWVDSIDSKTLEHRTSYCSQCILNFSPFASDLSRGRDVASAKFIGENFAYAGGIRMHPSWDMAFNGDGNQLGQHYPVGSDLLYLKTARTAGRQDLLAQWLGWVERFWNQNTVPEGTTAEAENDGPSYPDCPGGKQAFSVKSWFMGILNAIVGVYFDIGGVTVVPGIDRGVKLEGIHFGGRRWSVRRTGSGKYITRLRVNGAVMNGCCKIPTNLIKGKVINIEVECSAKPGKSVQVLSADGASLSDVTPTREGLRVDVAAWGSVYVRFAAPKKPTVTWKGKPMAIEYDATLREGQVLLSDEAKLKIRGALEFKTGA